MTKQNNTAFAGIVIATIILGIICPKLAAYADAIILLNQPFTKIIYAGSTVITAILFIAGFVLTLLGLKSIAEEGL